MTNKIHNTEEQLYDQFMTELEEGAKEYDSMMARGKAPALRIRQAHPLQLCWLSKRKEPKASKSKATIVSMMRRAIIAACFVGLIMGGYLYFLNDTDERQLAIADNSKQKETESNTIKKEVMTVNNIAVLHTKKKDVKRFYIKKDIEIKKAGDYECFLPDIVLNVPDNDVKDGNTAQYPNIRKEYDFDVVCYNVLPEINNSDNKAIASANFEIKQICDNIYYNDIKPLKHSQQ